MACILSSSRRSVALSFLVAHWLPVHVSLTLSVCTAHSASCWIRGWLLMLLHAHCWSRLQDANMQSLCKPIMIKVHVQLQLDATTTIPHHVAPNQRRNSHAMDWRLIWMRLTMKTNLRLYNKFTTSRFICQQEEPKSVLQFTQSRSVLDWGPLLLKIELFRFVCLHLLIFLAQNYNGIVAL